MIQSMTAFARQQVQGDWGTLVWEIRSVNQRYLEISLRLPDGFRELEALLRAAIRQSIQRGKIECTLRYAPGPSVQADVKINAGLVVSDFVSQDSFSLLFEGSKMVSE